jgi:hypothetical protein
MRSKVKKRASARLGYLLALADADAGARAAGACSAVEDPCSFPLMSTSPPLLSMYSATPAKIKKPTAIFHILILQK